MAVAHRQRAAGDVRAGHLGGAVRRAAEHLEREPQPAAGGRGRRARAGRALDIGSGEGADAIWLAGRGWSVTGLDFSRVALDRAAEHAAAAGAGVAARTTWRQADLRGWSPPAPPTGGLRPGDVALLPPARPGHGTTCSRVLAAAVAPGGTLLVVGHHPGDLRHRPPVGRGRHDVHRRGPGPAARPRGVARRGRRGPAPRGPRPRRRARGRSTRATTGARRGTGGAWSRSATRCSGPAAADAEWAQMYPPEDAEWAQMYPSGTPSRRRCTPQGRRVGADVRSDRPPLSGGRRTRRPGRRRSRPPDGPAACRSRPGGTPRPRRARPRAPPPARRWRTRSRRAARCPAR